MDQSDELIEIVNNDNKVVGLGKRGYVHDLNLMHRSVHIVLLNKNNEIFLQQRAWHKDSEPGKWDTSAAGHVSLGESTLVAAKRECNEELGLRTPSLELIFSMSASARTGYEFIDIFLCRSDVTPAPDPIEIIASQWCSSEDLCLWIKKESEIFTTVLENIFIWLRGHNVL